MRSRPAFTRTVSHVNDYEKVFIFKYETRLINNLKSSFPSRRYDPETRNWHVSLNGPLAISRFNQFVTEYGFQTVILEPETESPSEQAQQGTIFTDLPWN